MILADERNKSDVSAVDIALAKTFLEIAETGPNARRLRLIPQGERYERLVSDLAAARAVTETA